MIELTEAAAKQIRTLAANPDAAGKLLRVMVESGGCSGLEYGMTFDQPKDGDHQLESQGITFLVDPKSLEQLKGSRVHFDDGLTGKGFEVTNPNAQSTCGCGRSFN
jgi:iron-sulfur cluster assembly accessory protein